MKKTEQLNVLIENDIKEMLIALAEKDGTDVSGVVRSAIKIYLWMSKAKRLSVVFAWMSDELLLRDAA